VRDLRRAGKVGSGVFRDGFTLIELLVVIAIIAILAAILFPIFAAAKQSGYAASCASNMHQLSEAVLMYVNDHDGWMVPAFTEPAKWDKGTAWTWRYSIVQYVKNRAIYGCPAFKRESKDWWGVPQMNSGKDDYASTYGINMDVAGNNSTIWEWGCRKMDVFPRHSKTLLLLENSNGFFYPTYDTLIQTKDAPYLKLYFPYWHKGKMNVSFLDGHVKLMYLRDTLSTEPQNFLWFDVSMCGKFPGLPANYNTWLATVNSMLRNWPRNYPPNGG